jgi:hypothetical protein
MTVAEAPADKTPQEYFNDLRQWVVQHCGAGHPVRQAGYQMSLTAIVHRLIKFGPDETINHLTGRDLLNLLIYTNGEIAEWLMRAAFTRALIEDDREVFEYLANTIFMPECRLWYWKIVEGLAGLSPDPAALTKWIEELPPAEKALARLLIARVYPDTAHVSWLDEVPEDSPAIAYQLAIILSLKKDCRNVAERFLREHPLVRNQAFN